MPHPQLSMLFSLALLISRMIISLWEISREPRACTTQYVGHRSALQTRNHIYLSIYLDVLVSSMHQLPLQAWLWISLTTTGSSLTTGGLRAQSQCDISAIKSVAVTLTHTHAYILPASFHQMLKCSIQFQEEHWLYCWYFYPSRHKQTH